ncbi:helix-turn-helix domain-containing protein [Salinisphaera orenii]|uniref:helix-turn-helix domain-containing protein n=1 Tax=Salinisphaera orenii TaxID=856731 RepID=UPI000DBE85E6
MAKQTERIKHACSRCSLADLCLPYGLDLDEIAQLESNVSPSHDVAGDALLFDQGESFQALYAVSAGSFKTSVLDADGLEQIMGFYYAGDLLGLDGLADKTHQCTALAIEHSQVCRLPFDQIENLMTRLPALRNQLMRLMSRELTDDEQQLLTLGRKNSEGRMASLLIGLSRRRATRGLDASRVSLNMKRADLANYLGMRMETVSRVLNKLQSDGLLHGTRREVTIADSAALSARAGSAAWIADQ